MIDASIFPESLPVREPNPYTDEQRICKRCGAEFIFKARDQVAMASTGDYCGGKCSQAAKREAAHATFLRDQKRREMKRAGYLL